MDVYTRLKELNLVLPNAPKKGGLYSPVKEFGGNLAYVSGCGPVIDAAVAGKLGKDFSAEEGQQFARNCILNLLAALEKEIGDLNHVKNCVKILVLVAGTDTFYQQPQVADGASRLLMEVFGDAVGTPSRSAIGVNALPGNIPVEVEGLFEIGET